MRQRGAFVSGIVFLGLILGVAVIVMALSSQSSTARGAQASTTLGRYAAELAESAVDEALADFTSFMNEKMNGQNPRELLATKAEGGVVPAAVFTGGAASWSYTAPRTDTLNQQGKTGIKVSPVTIRPLYYSIAQNFGEVELSCYTTYRMAGVRELYRRVTAKHYFVLDADGQTFRVNPTPLSVVADRSPET